MDIAHVLYFDYLFFKAFKISITPYSLKSKRVCALNTYFKLEKIDKERPDLPFDVKEEVNIKIKYEGYIKQQMNQVSQFKKMENKLLPEDIDYSEISNLRIEAKQKLTNIRPVSIGQASRITGVSPADITVLLIYLEQNKKRSE